MEICLIWAQDLNGAIGKNNTMPWHLPEDLRYFKELTSKRPVLMGRKTWEALPIRPLPDRTNIVVGSRLEGISEQNAFPCKDLRSAIDLAAALKPDQLFVIGGGQIYRELMALADTAYVTKVHTSVTGADTFAPSLDGSWSLLEASEIHTSKAGLQYHFEVWRRLKSR